jgi:hypothetical protein
MLERVFVVYVRLIVAVLMAAMLREVLEEVVRR